jgi:16S rRNA G966 N2-methylase RsmD
MLKIVGGKHRGRTLATLEGLATRPTSSRAREALFNILTHANWRQDGTSPLIDARVLDAFAGSGALGLEALSRGAAHATFLDNDATAIRLIGENLRKLGETGAAKVIRADATARRPAASPATSSSSTRPTAPATPRRRWPPSTRPDGWRRRSSRRWSSPITRTCRRRPASSRSTRGAMVRPRS